MVIGVLALQGDVREHLAALQALGASGRPVRRPEELDSADALILPGGESTTMSKLAIDFGLLEPLRKRVAEGMPASGCWVASQPVPTSIGLSRFGSGTCSRPHSTQSSPATSACTGTSSRWCGAGG